MNPRTKVFSVLFVLLLALYLVPRESLANAATIPDPAVNEALAAKKGHVTVVVAGGCFWGIQAVFEHVKGVSRATAGYSGGTVKNPGYEEVSTGSTGHAESVEIVYDPSKITLGQLLKIFFSVAHDPTELNRQGPDTGTQYRSAIYFVTQDQQKIAQAYVDQLNQARVFSGPIVTQIAPLAAFYRAEQYHQDFATQHPDNPYIARFDLPKIKQLQQQFPNLYH
ncbi:MAG TPA: peptide-methionine (S)-S-oxide reductase MsrA [Candidatus Saccharimonadales bacterium]|nr:peptide-methionine (S)-S-oxide reductase MsrA [Candidatus Saccharimonadales bacterium]